MLELQLRYKKETLAMCQQEANKSLVKEIVIQTIEHEIRSIERKIAHERKKCSKESRVLSRKSGLIRHVTQACHRLRHYIHGCYHAVLGVSAKRTLQTQGIVK